MRIILSFILTLALGSSLEETTPTDERVDNESQARQDLAEFDFLMEHWDRDPFASLFGPPAPTIETPVYPGAPDMPGWVDVTLGLQESLPLPPWVNEEFDEVVETPSTSPSTGAEANPRHGSSSDAVRCPFPHGERTASRSDLNADTETRKRKASLPLGSDEEACCSARGRLRRGRVSGLFNAGRRIALQQLAANPDFKRDRIIDAVRTVFPDTDATQIHNYVGSVQTRVTASAELHKFVLDNADRFAVEGLSDELFDEFTVRNHVSAATEHLARRALMTWYKYCVAPLRNGNTTACTEISTGGRRRPYKLGDKQIRRLVEDLMNDLDD